MWRLRVRPGTGTAQVRESKVEASKVVVDAVHAGLILGVEKNPHKSGGKRGRYLCRGQVVVMMVTAVLVVFVIVVVAERGEAWALRLCSSTLRLAVVLHQPTTDTGTLTGGPHGRPISSLLTTLSRRQGRHALPLVTSIGASCTTSRVSIYPPYPPGRYMLTLTLASSSQLSSSITRLSNEELLLVLEATLEVAFGHLQKPDILVAMPHLSCRW